jgi:preprotein translocase subunit SecD
MRRAALFVCALVALTACWPIGRRSAPSPKAGEPKATAPKAVVPKAAAPTVATPKPTPIETVEFRLAEDKPARGTQAMTIPGTNETVRVHKTPVLDAKDVASAAARKSLWMDRGYSIAITLTPDGARKLEKVTTDNVGKRLAILVAGKLVSAPIIREPILDGSAVIEGGNISEQEASILTAKINAAAKK